MPRVMMRCTYSNKEFPTGLDRARQQGLKGLAEKVIECPYCSNHHYLRRLYFEGDQISDSHTDVYALDVQYGFAAEIGVLISVMAMIEGYLPALLAKLTSISGEEASITMGTFYNFTHRVDLLEILAKQGRHGAEISEDVLFLAKRIRAANNIRIKYAHAKYSVGSEMKVWVEPFYGDARKKPQTIIMTSDDVAQDVETVKSITRQVHAYLHRGERPKRSPDTSREKSSP